jgi:hypothetical protein
MGPIVSSCSLSTMITKEVAVSVDQSPLLKVRIGSELLA